MIIPDRRLCLPGIVVSGTARPHYEEATKRPQDNHKVATIIA
nr:MAG TPA: hypothetical protein [Caudoviricetes sp.]